MSVSEDFFAFVTREITEIASDLDEREKAALDAVMGDFLLKPPEVSSFEKSVFMAGLLAFARQVPVKDIFKTVYRSLSASNRKDRVAVRARFRSYVTARLSEEKWKDKYPAQLIDRLFGISGGRPASQTEDGGTTSKKVVEGDGSRRRRRVTTHAVGNEHGTLLPGSEQQEMSGSEAGRVSGRLGDRQVMTREEAGPSERDNQVVPMGAIKEIGKLTEKKAGVFIVPPEGCCVDLTGKKISMTSFGIEEKPLPEFQSEINQMIVDLTDRFSAVARQRDLSLEADHFKKLARLAAAFVYGYDTSYDNFVFVSTNSDARTLFDEVRGQEQSTLLDVVLDRLGLRVD